MKQKFYYTARSFIMANDMMEKFSNTIFVFDLNDNIKELEKNLSNYLENI